MWTKKVNQGKKSVNVIVERFKKFWSVVVPGPLAWQGAAWGVLFVLVAILIAFAINIFAPAGISRFIIGTLGFFAALAIAGGLLTLVWRIFKNCPAMYIWALACIVVLLILLALFTLPVLFGTITVILGAVITASVLGAGAAVLRKGWLKASRIQRVITIAGLVIGAAGLALGSWWLLFDGTPLRLPADAGAQAAVQRDPLLMPDPSETGSYPVKTLFYGSGSDLHRHEFGGSADLITDVVDGSPLVDNWSWLRSRYWGFGPAELPINGRVWYPEGEGPFPLVLIVHGNHPMEDYSDTGYGYLGELLASRGFILASVDENFLNMSLYADMLIASTLKEENDLRGWLLLEHLRVWDEWNQTPGNPFYQKVDLDNVALAGHSRGGEAVAVAAAFNDLAYYPEDASLSFDYGFNIKSIIAISPSDGQYKPTGRGIFLEDVNYLVLHGAHDMDVVSFSGSKQFSRIDFSDDGTWFKTSLYILGANHGQFNTSWGKKDLFEPLMRVFNLRQLMPPDQQTQIAKVYISAFLESTLAGEIGYIPMFQDHSRAKAWLPDTVFINQYVDARTRLISTYEDDIDLETATMPSGLQEGKNLTVWKEQVVQAKWNDMENNAVFLGWDAAEKSATASYTIKLPKQGLALGPDSVLVFSMADAKENSVPDKEVGGEETDELADLTVEIIDTAGEAAAVPLSSFMLLQPRFEGQISKAGFMSPLPVSEIVFQHYEFPLDLFTARNSAINHSDLAEIRLVFDRTGSGTIALDDIGFRERQIQTGCK